MNATTRDLVKAAGAFAGITALPVAANVQSFPFPPNHRYPEPTLLILDPSFLEKGKPLAFSRLAERRPNVAFGGLKGNGPYIAARHSLHAMSLASGNDRQANHLIPKMNDFEERRPEESSGTCVTVRQAATLKQRLGEWGFIESARDAAE